MMSVWAKRAMMAASSCGLLAWSAASAVKPVVLDHRLQRSNKIKAERLPQEPAVKAPRKSEDAMSRPLFTWSRRPLPTRPATPVMAAETPPPPFSLRGAILMQRTRVAIIERPGEPEYLRVAEGSEVDGWTVVKVDSESAHLKSGSREISLELLPSGQ